MRKRYYYCTSTSKVDAFIAVVGIIADAASKNSKPVTPVKPTGAASSPASPPPPNRGKKDNKNNSDGHNYQNFKTNKAANRAARELGYKGAEDLKRAYVFRDGAHFNMKYDLKTGEIILVAIRNSSIVVKTGLFLSQLR